MSYLCVSWFSVDDILTALGSIVGRKHPSTTQTRQLKQSLPMTVVVLNLLSSQVCGLCIYIHFLLAVNIFLLFGVRVSVSVGL